MKTIQSFVLALVLATVSAGAATYKTDGQTNSVTTRTNVTSRTNIVHPTAVTPATRGDASVSSKPPVITQRGATPPPPAPGVPSPAARAVAPTIPAPGAPGAPGVPAPGAPAAAAAPSKTEEIVGPFNFDNMPLGQVLDIYSELVNRTILRPSNLPTTTFISLKTRGTLTKSEGITAIETVLAMNGFTIIPIGDKFVKVVQEGNAPQQGGEFYKGDAKDLPVAGRFVTQIVQLKYVPVQDAVAAITPFAKGLGGSIVPIQSSQTLVIRDYSENIKRMMEIIEKIDNITPIDVKPEVIPIKYALAGDIAQVLGSLTSSGPGISVGTHGRSGLSNTGASGYPGGTSGAGTTPGATPTPGQSMMSSPATSGRSSFQNRLQQIVNRAASSGEFQILGEAKIIADERTNSLLIFANDTDMVMIKTIIEQLDVVLAQVLIEAIIMDVELNDQFDAGISYLQQPKSLGGNVSTAGAVNNTDAFLRPGIRSFFQNAGTNASSPIAQTGLPSGLSYFTTIGDSFSVALTLAASDSRFQVLSRPRIQTSHAVEARLFDGKTIPYVTGTYFGYGSGGQSSSQYQQKEVGVSLTVLPLINPDGLVVMDIAQNIEDQTGSIKIDQNDVPITSKREALAKVAVRDRETIILGGFIRSKKNETTSGVPWLKDIPGLGFLFRSKGKTSERSELMVFIRPTVLPTPEAAALAATDERDKLPGVKRAEFELREEERKRNEAAESEMRKKLGLKEPKTK